MNNRAVALISIFSAFIGAIVAGLVLLLVMPDKPTSQEITEDSTVVQDDVSPIDKTPSVEFVDQTITNEIIYVKDGDVWRANTNGSEQIKLIDRDNVETAKRSSLGNFIAYDYSVEVQEVVEEANGEETQITATKTILMLADARGTTSEEIVAGIGRWGWVPGEELLWYEEASLQRFFGFDYYGDSSLHLYNPQTGKSTQLLQATGLQNRLSMQVSPNGEYFSFYAQDKTAGGASMEFSVIERASGETVASMEIPYVGGDRGGPPPVPSYEWHPQSSATYLAFNPLWFNEEEIASGFADKFKVGNAHFYRIDIETGIPELLNNSYPSSVMNDEVLPKPVFFADYSKVAFTMKKEAADQEDFYNRSDADLVLLDFETNQITKVGDVDGLGISGGQGIINWHLNTNSAFLQEDESIVYFSEFGTKEVHISRIDTASASIVGLDEITYEEQTALKAPLKPSGEHLWFLIADRLFVIDDEVVEVLTGVTDFQVNN